MKAIGMLPSVEKKIDRPIMRGVLNENRSRISNLVHSEFRNSNLTYDDLAKRLGTSVTRVQMLFGSFDDWNLDIVAELLFAISGSVLTYQLEYSSRRTD